MRKFTLFLFLVCASVVSISAQQHVNNPKDADGYYIVKWDCTTNSFAASNNFEADETFTFAVDIKGTPWEAWLKETPTATGATRSLAFNKWTNFGDVNGDSHRLKPISGTVYGATWNLAQLATTALFDEAVKVDSVVYVYGQLFGFEYTADNPGAGWWMWVAGVEGGSQVDPGTGSIFRTLKYTGTKTSAVEIYNGDYGDALFGTAYPNVKGYAPACAVSTSVKNPSVSNAPIVERKYYNYQGMELSKKPAQGIYLEKVIRADGSSSVNKLFQIKE